MPNWGRIFAWLLNTRAAGLLNGNRSADFTADEGETAWNEWTGWNTNLVRPTETASPKPTWAQLQVYNREYELWRFDGRYDGRVAARERATPPLTGDPNVMLEIDSALQGVQLHNVAAGQEHPLIVTDADRDGALTYIRTPQHLETVLETERASRIQLASAKAIVRSQLAVDRKIAADHTKTIAVREAAKARLDAALRQTAYDVAITAAIGTLSAEPTDVDEFRQVAIHKIEVAATRRKRFLLGDTLGSRQGDWMLETSCAQQRAAMDQLANQLTRARLELHHLTTINALRIRRDNWIRSFGAVEVADSAEWRDVTSTAGDAISGDYAGTFKVKPSASAQDMGSLYLTDPRTDNAKGTAIESVECDNEDVSWVFDFDGPRTEVRFTYDGNAVPSPAKINIVLIGRSTCGPKRLVASYTASLAE